MLGTVRTVGLHMKALLAVDRAPHVADEDGGAHA
jgi:hypothetical protein